jgi:pre-mRNA-splicing factor ATP-dependent RNA helicase DHX15/PRP43
MDVDWCYKNYLNYRHLKAADDVREQLKQLMIKVQIPVKDEIPIQANVTSIKKCLLTGYFTQIALLQKNNVYLTSKNDLI